ncbi:MAG TPA: HEAT repeat domain-containing protein [Sandaracinaceae bacterium]
MNAPVPELESSPIALDRLLRRLREGAGADDAELRQALGLSADAPDGELARALVRVTSSALLARVGVSPERDHDERTTTVPAVMTEPDASFLGRLGTRGQDDEKPQIGKLGDVHTLLAVLRAGTLAQRRAAALRLGARLAEGKDLSTEELRAASTTLLAIRDVEIAFEVSRAREALPGAPGRQARQETEEFGKLLEPLVRAIDDFWAGQSSSEPIAALPPDQRAQLMVRLRDAPDVVLHHIGSVLDASDGASTPKARQALLSSLRYSGDPRLLPSLVGLIATRNTELVGEAARALAHIDDPRVHPALAAAYERSVVDYERALLAGSLGIVGDVRGRDYVRKLLASDDERVLLAATFAMETLATSEDLPALVALLERSDPVLLGSVIRAIGRTGDPRALVTLDELRRALPMSGLWGDIEDAEATIRAVMELRGEEAPDSTVSLRIATAQRSAMDERKRDPAVVRLRSWTDYLIGHLWLAVGGVKRAFARFERAAARRPGWAAPLAAIALHHARKERTALALAAFRRALEADKRWVERQVYVVGALARVFLRRAEEVEKGGRVDIARGLIEEVLALDLRRVASELRFELTRRQEQLRLRSAG